MRVRASNNDEHNLIYMLIFVLDWTAAPVEPAGPLEVVSIKSPITSDTYQLSFLWIYCYGKRADRLIRPFLLYILNNFVFAEPFLDNLDFLLFKFLEKWRQRDEKRRKLIEKLIEKIDRKNWSKNWFKKLIQKIDRKIDWKYTAIQKGKNSCTVWNQNMLLIQI